MVYIWKGVPSDNKAIARLNEYNNKEVIGMTNHVLVNYEGKLIKEGLGKNGYILANLEGDFIKEGNSNSGKIIAVIMGNEIIEADSEHRLLFKIEGIASKIEKAALTVAALILDGQI
ncbi:hypothetical protein [Candidatus Clostridium stratigraminis]|uniref:Uncharacterized protein n=1 Tax=Candidatus Clostridium stratigraminis TaxID=3381661 RepID=A0ABW8T205_9CLOT